MNNLFFKISYLLLCSVVLLSCKENNSSATLLVQAQKVADNNPSEALSLLDSINVEELNKDDYMQYIVTRVQAKFKNSQSIANDTLIFEARDYFDTKENPAQSALAHFYSGNVYYQKNIKGKALKSYIEADAYANLSKDTILKARSQNNIGHLYYEQDVMDSAIFHYRLALDCYDKVKNADQLKMQTIYSMGSAFYTNYDLDSAYYFYDKGLRLANELGDKKYQGIFTNHLGVVDRVKGNNEDAQIKLHSSLGQTTSCVDSLRIYLNLSKLYNTTQQVDSARFYTELLKNRLSEITDKRILKSTYGSLLDHNKQLGNYIDALRYAELELEVGEDIKAESQLLELLDADKKYALEQKDKQIDYFHSQVIFWLIISGVVFISLLMLSICLLKLTKSHKKEIKLKADKYRNIRDQLISMGAEYKDIEAEIASMLDEEPNKDKGD